MQGPITATMRAVRFERWNTLSHRHGAQSGRRATCSVYPMADSLRRLFDWLAQKELSITGSCTERYIPENLAEASF